MKKTGILLLLLSLPFTALLAGPAGNEETGAPMGEEVPGEQYQEIRPSSTRDVGVHVGLDLAFMGDMFRLHTEDESGDISTTQWDTYYKMPIGASLTLTPQTGLGLHTNIFYATTLAASRSGEAKSGDKTTVLDASLDGYKKDSFNIEAFATIHGQNSFIGFGPTFNFQSETAVDGTSQADTSIKVFGVGMILGFGLSINEVTVIPNAVFSYGFSKSSTGLTDLKKEYVEAGGDYGDFSFYYKVGLTVTYAVLL